MKHEIRMEPETWRYGQLYKVEGGGETTVVAAFNVADAISRAAREWNMSKEALRETVVVSEPSGTEILESNRSRHQMTRMVVRHPEHPEAHVLAICRVDAVLFACRKWDTDYYPTCEECRVYVERRVPMEEDKDEKTAGG